MKLAFIGIGNVGYALANKLYTKGHEVLVATDRPDSESVLRALKKNPGFSVASHEAAIANADLLFLAIPFQACEELVSSLDFKGKVLIDCTNPVGSGITHALESRVSGSEQIERWAHNSRVVKAFSIYGYENLAAEKLSSFPVRPMMLVAGDDPSAKEQLSPLVAQMGFELLDTGPLKQALHLEHMTLLWIKMVRQQGHSPNLLWARLPG